MLPSSFDALKKYDQFILYRLDPLENGKTNKVPQSVRNWPRIENGDPHDPAVWLTFDQVVETLGNIEPDHNYGLGFVFTDKDPFFCIDVDACYDVGAAKWSDLSLEMLRAFPGACVEWSVSRTGIHIFGTYRQIDDHKTRDKATPGLELYTAARFVALTGIEVYAGHGDTGADFTAELDRLIARTFKRVTTDGGAPLEWTREPVPEYTPIGTDDEIIQRLNAWKSYAKIFGDGLTFADLFGGNVDALARAFPSSTDVYNRSSADMALSVRFAFATGKNCDHIWRLLWKSALVRDKWRERPEYVQRTIINAVNFQKAVYTGKKKKEPAYVEPGAVVSGTPPTNDPAPGSAPSNLDANASSNPGPGVAILPLTDQLILFKGCVYVANRHRVFMPNGELVKPETFKALFGGYSFVLDGNGKLTKNAFEALTESQLHHFSKVGTTCFRPDLEPGLIISRGTITAVNTFVPQYGAQVKGDAGPFLDHVARLIPNEADRAIVLSYLAACIRYPGVKFQWTPLVQGVPGNGKTVLYHVLEYALGAAYCHQVDPKDLDNKFNAWVTGHMLVCIEEIRTGGRRDVADALKPLITNRRVATQAKGADQQTSDNCANFLLFSNHKDAVLKTIDDRRYCVFYTAQQDVDDLALCGMNGKYFRDLYKWLDHDGGAAAVAYYLAIECPITIDLMGRAPNTSSTDEALIASQGIAEHILMEAIDAGAPGFTGGLIDVQDAVDHLAREGRKFSAKKVGAMLRSLRYDLHPALKENQGGRVNVAGRKRRIFVLKHAIVANIETPDQVADKWLELKTKALTPNAELVTK